MRNLWLITKEDFINLARNPMWLFYATGFPVLLVLIMGYLTRKSYGNTVTSYDFYGITLMIYSLINSGMTSANAFLEERIKKPNMRIIYAPGSVKNIFLSKIIASFAFSFLFHLLDMVFLHLAFGVDFGGIHLYILFGLTELMAVTLGIMMCCIVKTESMTNQVQSIVVNILAILGGTLFSIDGYGSFARKISRFSPVKWVVDASFQIVYDHSTGLFVPVAAGIIGATAVMVLVCMVTFGREDCIC